MNVSRVWRITNNIPLHSVFHNITIQRRTLGRFAGFLFACEIAAKWMQIHLILSFQNVEICAGKLIRIFFLVLDICFSTQVTNYCVCVVIVIRHRSPILFIHILRGLF